MSRCVLVLMLLASLGMFSLPAGDWPHYRGPDGLGGTDDKAFGAGRLADPDVAWKAAVGIGFSSMTIEGPDVYVMGWADGKDSVYCLSAENGEPRWTHAYENPLSPWGGKAYRGGPNATPTVAGDYVYTVSKEGDLHCLARKNGDVVWKKHYQRDFGAEKPEWGFSGSVLVMDERLYIGPGGQGASAVALEPATGKVIWKAGNDKPGYSSPMPMEYKGTRYILFFNAAGLVMRKAADGAEVARHPWKTNYDVNAAAPLVIGSRILISSGYNHGAALLRFNGDGLDKVWENQEMRNHFNSGVLIDKNWYGFDEGELRCLDARNGKVKWSAGGLGKGSLIRVNDHLLVLGDKGDLVTYKATGDGASELSRAKVLDDQCWTQPAYANGRLYLRDTGGNVVCIRAGK